MASAGWISMLGSCGARIDLERPWPSEAELVPDCNGRRWIAAP